MKSINSKRSASFQYMSAIRTKRGVSTIVSMILQCTALPYPGQSIVISLSPAVADLSIIVDRAAGAEWQIRTALAGFSWRSMLMVSGIVLGVLLMIWFASMASITWQRYQIDSLSQERATLEAEIRTLQTQSNDLAKRGARIKLETCGNQQRLCVQVEQKMRYGERGEFYVLKGY